MSTTKAAGKEDRSSANATKNSSDNWKLPNIPVHNLYKITPFRIFPNNVIIEFEQTISYKPVDKFGTLNSLSSDFLDSFIKKKHNFLHLGLVQIAIKPLVRDGLDAPVVVCIRDARHHNLHNSLLALVESNLSQGPIYFNCFPSFSVSLSDNSYLEALNLSIKATGIPTGVPVALAVRVVCKAMVDLDAEFLVEPVLGKTSSFHASSGTPVTTQWVDVLLEILSDRSVSRTRVHNGLVVRSVSSGYGGIKWL